MKIRTLLVGALIALTACAGSGLGGRPISGTTVVSADGVPIHYSVRGNGEIAVVLVHGWACDSGYWNEQVDALRATYTVVRLDLGGHGQSGAQRSDWSIARFGDDVAAVVRALPNRRFVLVGHSMGGPAVIAAAGRLSGRPGLIGVLAVDTLKNVGRPPPPPPARAAIIASFQKDFAGTIRANGERMLFTTQSDPALVNRINEQMSRMPPSIAIPMLGGLFDTSWEAAFLSIHVPIVAINSDLGGPTDDDRIRKIAPTFRSVTLAGMGHFMMLEHPARFNAELLKQLALLDAG